jgi:hypothetical protein
VCVCAAVVPAAILHVTHTYKCLYTAECHRSNSNGPPCRRSTIRFPDNRRFEGEFRDNKKNGHGRYEGANGIYEGNYVDGKKSGHGSFSWIDGSRYEVPRVLALERGRETLSMAAVTRYRARSLSLSLSRALSLSLSLARSLSLSLSLARALSLLRHERSGPSRTPRCERSSVAVARCRGLQWVLRVAAAVFLCFLLFFFVWFCRGLVEPVG